MKVNLATALKIPQTWRSLSLSQVAIAAVVLCWSKLNFLGLNFLTIKHHTVTDGLSVPKYNQKSNLTQTALKGEIALVTGVVWLGANLVIAEIDEKTIKSLKRTLTNNLGRRTQELEEHLKTTKRLDKRY